MSVVLIKNGDDDDDKPVNESRCTPETTSVWPTLQLKIASRKVGV